MAIILAARALATIFKVGPRVLKLKPLVIGAKLGTKGQIVGKIVEAKIVKETVSLGLNITGASSYWAGLIAGATFNDLSSGRITSVPSAAEGLAFGEERTAAAILTAGAPPFIRNEILIEAAKLKGVPTFWIAFAEILL